MITVAELRDWVKTVESITPEAVIGVDDDGPAIVAYAPGLSEGTLVEIAHLSPGPVPGKKEEA